MGGRPPPERRLTSKEARLADVVFVLVIVAFFALAVLFVKACDRIIGPDEATAAPEATEDRMAA